MASDSAQGVAVVDIGAQRLERHVRRAFEQAWTLSGGRPLSAAHLLRACIAIGGSEAFTTLANLLPLSVAAKQPVPDLPPFNLNAVALEPPLADSFYVAESFFAASGSEVWGRDLVTLALLSRGDPSLHELASQADTTISDLRAKWLLFVRESKRHRTAEDWDRWWRASGLTPAGDTPTQTSGTDAYLLTWNPARYSESQMAEHVERRTPDGYVTFGWSSGNNRSMTVGDRVFLLRQGVGRRGLVGVGTVAAAPREADHWDKILRAEGRTSWLVQVRWEAIDVEPMVALSTLVADTGESRLWATQVGGVSIAPAVRERLEELWPGAWERHQHNLDPVLVTDLAPKHLIARFDPDLGAATDSLNVQRYVDAFARIAASRALTPPLSVGIFGDWGSGKTFFMERVEAKIKQLADGDEGVQDDLFVRNVCQMRFNAWHFAETDLWASLVSTIFKELRRHLDPTDNADEFNKLLNKLEIARALREHAETQLRQAERTLQDAQAEVAKAQEALAELPAKPEPPTDDELRAILKENLKDLGDEPESMTKTLSGLFDEAYKLTGDEAFMTAHKRIDSGQATVEEANNLLVETRALVSRSGFWWRLLTTAKVHRTRAFCAVLVVAVVIPVAFVVIQSQVDFPVGWSAGLLEAFTVVGALVVWVRSTLARAAPVFNALDRMQGAIERDIDDAQGALRRKYEEDRTEALQAQDAARRELANAQESRDQAESELEAAQAALRESTSQARLGRFIRERATSPDYDKYLGLSAMIRRDFEELSDLMTPGPGPHDPTLPRIDRIILYIDDLDRCYPPTKVVRVLEAVHLLLFFPLFVVFVCVDSRWVSRALNRHYDQMLSDEALQVDGAGSSSSRAPANSQDFLEKIFQVPFWLRRMDPPAVQRMIHRLISAHEVEADHHQLDVDQLGEGGDAPSLGDDGDKTTAPTPVEASKAGAQLVASEAEGYGETIGEPAAPPTEALRIRKAELDFMDQVAPLMPRTPRAVKRFVNIYRLYKAALSTPGLSKFLGSPEHPGNFRAVQVLLALVIGTPDFAKAVVEVLDGLAESSGQRLSDLPSLLPEQTVPTWQTTLNALATFATADNDLTLTSLREVSPLVTRYSLHHMVSVLPGESTLP